MQDCKVNILGSEWAIEFRKQDEDQNLIDNDGYTDSSVKLIVIDDMTSYENENNRKKDIPAYQKQILRHEIIHAFLVESGLDGNGHPCDHWEYNEEMVDWIAIQSPKLFKVFRELNIL